MANDLLKQFDDLTKNIETDLRSELRQKANDILKVGLDFFRGYVPIDTQLLKTNIKGQVFETDKGFEIRIVVLNTSIHNQPAIQLALYLEKGRGPGGAKLRRTRANIYAAARTPTRDWFENAQKDWLETAEQLLI